MEIGERLREEAAGACERLWRPQYIPYALMASRIRRSLSHIVIAFGIARRCRTDTKDDDYALE